MKECLACWEEIEDNETICHHCGSNQEEVKDYLALVLLKQGRRKIDVPTETPVLDYVFDTDPAVKEEISVSISSAPQEPEIAVQRGDTTSRITSNGTYSPEKPSWLASPTDDNQKETLSPQKKEMIPKSKTISCPKCSKDVPLLQYCKFCGQKLLRTCPNCNKEIQATAKFCTGCGKKVDPLIDRNG